MHEYHREFPGVCECQRCVIRVSKRYEESVCSNKKIILNPGFLLTSKKGTKKDDTEKSAQYDFYWTIHF